MKTTSMNLLFGWGLTIILIASPIEDSFAQESGQSTNVQTVALSESDNVVAEENLVDVLKAKGNYTTILSAIERTGMTDALGQEGPFTLLAPTDEAFSRSTDVRVDEMSFDELVRLIRHHLIVDEVTAEQASEYGALMTVNGDVLSVEQTNDAIEVENAEIVEADVKASNGLIQGIDAVMMPPAGDTAELQNIPTETSPDSVDTENENR